MLFFDPVVPLAGLVILGVVHYVPAVLPVVRVRVVVGVERIEVDLAERAGSPPGCLKRLHERRDVGIKPVAVGEQAVPMTGQTRGDTCAGRAADWIVGESIAKGYAHALKAP